jgi:hypothetical protein
MRSTTRLLVNYYDFLNSKLRMGALLFTTNCFIICALEDSAEAVSTSITGMKRVSGGTNAGKIL